MIPIEFANIPYICVGVNMYGPVTFGYLLDENKMF